MDGEKPEIEIAPCLDCRMERGSPRRINRVEEKEKRIAREQAEQVGLVLRIHKSKRLNSPMHKYAR
jgi:hypothetical protein